MFAKPKTPTLPIKLLAAALFLVVLSLCAGCMSVNNGSYIWMGDPVMTAQIDANGLPVGSITNFFPPPTTVYCYVAIRGPAGYKMNVRWYQDDELILEEEVNFGEARRAAPALTGENGQPLPEGIYRCEYTIGEQVIRDIGFLVLEE